MRKSIFTRYIVIFLIIIFLSFAILAGIMSGLTLSYANRQKRTAAIRTSELMINYFNTEKIYPSAKERAKEIQQMLNLLAKNADTLSIIIANEDGNIVFSSDNLEGNVNNTKITEIDDGTDYKIVSTDLNGIFPSVYTAVITPISYSSELMGTLIIGYNPHQTTSLTVNTTRVIIISSIWIMVTTLVAVYIITERVVAPINKMNLATKNFAKGKFDTRLPVKGDDEIAELSASFNKMAESLANIEYARSAFLANVSHDLRTPMTTISGFIDGIIDGAIPPEKQNYYLGIVAQETRRLSRLVSTLLDISRLESGTRKFEFSMFDICEMARIILISFENKIEDKKLDIDFDVSDEKILVFSDKDAINQVLYNLCDNAVKFSKDGGKLKLKISVEKEKAVVIVYNEGIGISNEDLEHIFDRFYKSDKSRGLDKTGVGLGLYICKTIMDNLSEELSVTSNYGENCSFKMTINLYKSI